MTWRLASAGFAGRTDTRCMHFAVPAAAIGVFVYPRRADESVRRTYAQVGGDTLGEYYAY
jgi:hypothetical protein